MSTADSAPVIHVLHENPDWFGPFQAAFEAAGVPYREWLLVDGVLDLDEAPPAGIYWSRISASAHTRGHGLSKDYTRSVLNWLDAYGTRTVNGRRTIELEMSKVDQLTRLRAQGFDVPLTRVVVGTHLLAAAAEGFPTPFITKHNQGGKGLGVQKFDSAAELAAAIEAGDYEEPEDGISLLQEFVVAARPEVTRVEIIGDEFIYAITADTARGGYQLCPADACAIDPTTGALLLPPGATILPEVGQQIFALREGFDHPIIDRYRAFLRAEGIEVAGIEFIETADGRIVTYDVNTNTNYNAQIEAAAPRSGPGAIVAYLAALLADAYPPAR
ncbi:MAG: alpha-L-glutamate ligase [Ramlibacter sp.]|nr:alpha-L-glutamate ligase [Cryobacterium sp.]